MPNNNMAAYVALDNGPKETSNETTIIAIIVHSPLESLSTNSHTAEITELLSQTNDSATAQSRVEDGQRSANVSYPLTSRVAMAVEWVKHMTIFKAILIISCLKVVAWGGMIFLLLCNAAPAMCHPTCDDINSPRRKWIEIDSQILNALFCAPAFGLAPRRFIEAWELLRYLSGRDSGALRRLAATYRGWFRLLGSQTVPSDIGPSGVESWLCQNPTLKDVVPHPSQSIQEASLSGKRAMPTALWKLQAVIGLNVMNTVFQAVLSGFMWGYNRHTRPSWSVGLFLCLAFAASIAAGVVGFIEGKRVRKIEGLAR
ncbi:hypothetical protein CEP51_012663 [Fusarium floridanum]|uniref:Uncharacterized protein n=1 Tax=Fusarium floridanum TaxID=1325733 RepID=A0A428QQ61_9HYPO|nr:hypothetical protein CEP51_012663 [Fusarium floridanum]